MLLLALDLLRAASYRPDADEAVERVSAVYTAIDQATPDPELRLELRRICRRESWCNLFAEVGQHSADASSSLGRVRWEGAVSRGLLDPDACPEHALGEDPARWSTWGPFGQTAVAVGHVTGCLPPESMADPTIAATVAVITFERICTRMDLCACEDRVAWWSGIGRWPAWSPVTRELKVAAVCEGRGGTLDLAAAGVAVVPWAARRGLLGAVGVLG